MSQEIYVDHQHVPSVNHKALYHVNPSQLSVLNYANHFTLWHYKTPHDSILYPSYFNMVADILRENDIMIATTNMDDTPKTSIYTIIAKAKEHIVISPLDIGSDCGCGLKSSSSSSNLVC